MCHALCLIPGIQKWLTGRDILQSPQSSATGRLMRRAASTGLAAREETAEWGMKAEVAAERDGRTGSWTERMVHLEVWGLVGVVKCEVGSLCPQACLRNAMYRECETSCRTGPAFTLSHRVSREPVWSQYRKKEE